MELGFLLLVECHENRHHLLPLVRLAKKIDIQEVVHTKKKRCIFLVNQRLEFKITIKI